MKDSSLLLAAHVLNVVNTFNYLRLWAVISLAKDDCFRVNYNSSSNTEMQVERETITMIDRPRLLGSMAAFLDVYALKTN
jgi:hypothetical protein